MVYTSGMKVIIGLGNPEQRYTGTRHNVGFAVLDEYVRNNSLSFTRSSKFHGDIAEKGTGEHKVLFLKPSTYYNLVGESARAVCDFYRILPQDVLIIHDDLALPLGTMRTRLGGSSAGNNGVKSLTQHLGEDTARLRVGIYSDQREYMDAADFVLSKFNTKERATLERLQHVAEVCIEDFIYGNLTPMTYSAEA